MIGSELEKMILSGDAVFKTASIGFGALNALTVSKGKAYVITEITIQPFGNIISHDKRFADPVTFSAPFNQDFRDILKRTTYQLLMYNSRTNNRWSLRADLQLNCADDGTGSPITNPTILFLEKKIDCYVLIEELTWFYFYFPDFANPNFPVVQQPLNTIFTNVNNFPPAPFGYGAEDTIEFLANLPGPQYYPPLGLVDDANPAPNSAPTWSIPNNGPDSPIIPPGPNPAYNMTALMLPSLPIMNVSYVEINKRTTTSGIS